jgi:photosystem II stability/assembly factor-like uncharacterized protein
MTVFEGVLHGEMGAWRHLGPVRSGGSVVALAISPIREVMGYPITPTSRLPLYWAATACGVYRSYTSGLFWAQYVAGLTTPLLSSLAVAMNGALFAGSPDGSLHVSMDFGKSWKPGYLPDALRAPVYALVTSPEYRKDRTAFAATDGAGVLVTRDAGTTWEAASSGLSESTVVALASSPDWSRLKTVFAGSSGVYVSEDGGHIWGQTDLVVDGDVVGALAVSPGFEQDRTVYAGTDLGSLFQSTDGGRHWALLQAKLGEGPVSCLWIAPDYATSGCMVAATGADVHVSSDRGKSWSKTAEMPGSILAMAGDDRSVVVGVYDAGVWESLDRGESWSSATGDMSARAYTQLSTRSGSLYAWGPNEGLWVSKDGGGSWQDLPGLPEYAPLTAACVDDAGCLLAAGHAGDVVRSADQGASWQTVAHVPSVRSMVLEPITGHGWIGTLDGRLLQSRNRGATWQDGLSPCPQEELLAVAASPQYASDHTLLAVTAAPMPDEGNSRASVWCSTNAGSSWRRVADRETSTRQAHIVFTSGPDTNTVSRAAVAIGPYCMHFGVRDDDGAVCSVVDPSGASVLSMIRTAGIAREGELYAATTSGVYRSIDAGLTWVLFDSGLPGLVFVSLAATSDAEQDSLYAMGLGGNVFRRDIP